MTDSIRDHIANVLAETDQGDGFIPDPVLQADALLADPTLAAIIDLAASHVDGTFDVPPPSPEVRALLRASRAEQEPER